MKVQKHGAKAVRSQAEAASDAMLGRGLAPAHPPRSALMSGVKSSAASAQEHYQSLQLAVTVAGRSREVEGGQWGWGEGGEGREAGRRGRLLPGEALPHAPPPPPAPPPAWLGAPAKALRPTHACSSSVIKFSSCSHPLLPVRYLDTDAHVCRPRGPHAAAETDCALPGPRSTSRGRPVLPYLQPPVSAWRKYSLTRFTNYKFIII